MTTATALPLSVPLFAAGAGVLVAGGVLLARASDEIAARTGWSRLLVGMVLVALATSLPEIVTDVSAAIQHAPDLAVGDLFGSSMANMAILAVVDLTRRGRVWPRVELGQARIGSVAIALTALAALAVATPTGPRLGWVGVDTMVIAVAYVAAIGWIRRSPTPPRAAEVPTPTGWAAPEGSLRSAWWRFAAAVALIGASAPFVAYAGKEIARASGLGESFVGVALVALSTSLPELVASLAAVRVGAHDLAVGNLFGSNAANMAVLFVVDVAYTRGPLLAAAGAGEVVAAVGAILLMALAVSAIVHGEETRIGRLEPDAVLLLLAWIGGLFAVWSVRP